MTKSKDSFLSKAKKELAKWSFCFFGSLVAAGILYSATSFFRPVRFTLEIAASKPQTITLFYSKNETFSTKLSQKDKVPGSEEPAVVSFKIPRKYAQNLRLRFGAPFGTIKVKNPTLNGKEISFIRAYYHKKVNIRFCSMFSDENYEILCRFGGSGAHITFPEQLVKEALFSFTGAIIFLFFFAICLFASLHFYPFLKSSMQRLAVYYSPQGLCTFAVIMLPCLYFIVEYSVYQAKLSSLPDLSFLNLIQADALVPALMLLGVLLISHTRNILGKIIVTLLLLATLTIQLTDFVLIHTLNARFDPLLAPTFVKGLGGAWPIIRGYLLSTAGWKTLLLLLDFGLLFYIISKHKENKFAQQTTAFIAVVLLTSYLIPFLPWSAQSVFFQDLPRKVVSRLIPPRDNPSADPSIFTPQYRCEKGLNGQQNIILLVIESLSSFSSQYFSNIEDNTPHLDQWAQKSLSFTNYRSNNYSTVQGLFNILTGFPFLQYTSEENILSKYKFFARSLPDIFTQAGYHMALFSSAGLVYGKDSLLNKMHFHTLSNDLDPFYSGQERFVFNSVSDEALYNRVLDWLKTPPNIPYFVIVETTTTHAPYQDPVSKKNSFPRALRYADYQADLFIRELEKNNFFENGILVITGDHRVMLPVTQQEKDHFGYAAEAFVPLIVVGKDFTGIDKRPASHLDLAPSLEYLTLPKACFHQYQQNLFKPKEEKHYCSIFQSMERERTVLVDCGPEKHTFCLENHKNISCGKEEKPLSNQTEINSFLNWLREY